MKYIIFLSFFTFSFLTQAAPLCSKNGTRIIYTNGVMTTLDDAQAAMEKIEGLSLNSQIDLKKIHEYILAYNYEESLSRDFLEAAVQRFPVGFLQSLGVTNGYAAYMGYLNGGLADAVYAVALNSITDKIVEIQSDWLINYRSGSLYLKTIQEIKGLYEESLNRGERVFAISHSQGGLFMSDAFDQVSFADKQKYFSGFQIASPLQSEMSSHFGHATHDKDRLINFVRGTVGALPANISAPLIVNNAYEGISDYAIDLVLNHGVVTTYLNDSTIKSQVISKLIEAAQLLESNCPKAVINYTKNNLVVNFDSTDPDDPNVTGLTYSWNFGDGKISTTSSKTLSHTYSVAGTYIVTLTVTDPYGASATVQSSILVVGGTAFVTLCNAGVLTSDFDFSIDGVINFSLHHNLRQLSSDPNICECKTIQLPINSTHSVAITGIIPELIGANPPGVENLLPYNGTIKVNNQNALYSIGGGTLSDGLIHFWINPGAIFGCDQFIYK